jgi:hypothetical protein
MVVSRTCSKSVRWNICKAVKRLVELFLVAVGLLVVLLAPVHASTTISVF